METFDVLLFDLNGGDYTLRFVEGGTVDKIIRRANELFKDRPNEWDEVVSDAADDVLDANYEGPDRFSLQAGAEEDGRGFMPGKMIGRILAIWRKAVGEKMG